MAFPIKPRIGISSCLLGQAVRYDGGHKRHTWLVEVLADRVEWVPFCPEMLMGLGTPRPTLHVEAGSPARLIETASARDLTELANETAAALLADPKIASCAAFILKSNSPSCGLKLPAGRGMVAAALAERFPNAILAQETDFDTNEGREAFLRRLSP